MSNNFLNAPFVRYYIIFFLKQFFTFARYAHFVSVKHVSNTIIVTYTHFILLKQLSNANIIISIQNSYRSILS